MFEKNERFFLLPNLRKLLPFFVTKPGLIIKSSCRIMPHSYECKKRIIHDFDVDEIYTLNVPCSFLL